MDIDQENESQTDNNMDIDESKEIDIANQENTSSKKSTDTSTSNTQDSNLVFDDDLTDEIKQGMIDKTPPDITTFEEALSCYY